MFTPELERGFRRMFYKSMYKEYPTEDDLMHCKQKDTTTPLETAPEDTAADVAPDIAIEIKPKADENTVRRVLAKQKDAENFVAEYNRRALQRRAAQKRESDATDSAKTGEDASTEDATPNDTQETKEIEVSRRGIMRSWPRAPNGPFIWMTGEGKTAGNNQPLWGATVLDFFRVQRHPDMPYGSTISTGSKLAEWAHAFEELHAKDELEWAAEEEDPIELLPCDISLIIRDMDHRSYMIRESFYETHKTVRALSCHYMRIPE